MFARAFFLGRRLFGTALGHIVGENSRNSEKKFFTKKIHRGYEKTVFCDFFTPNGVVTFSVWSVNLEPSTQ